jgi:transglutaminase-like putative cysteine protease
MNRVFVASSAVFVLAAVALAADGPPNMQPDPQFLKPAESRKFKVTYVAHVKDVPAGTKTLRLWFPVPQDTVLQTISDVSFEGAAPKVGTEPKFGNKIAYVEIADPKPNVDVTMRFTGVRKELVTDLSKLGKDAPETDASTSAFMGEENVTIIDDQVRKTAAEVTAGKATTLEKARAIYDYVLGKMTYDKVAPGWGQGDTKRAFEVCKGNCTDFHAMFMSLSRAAGIPAGFEIGLYLPYQRDKKDEKLGGYHCWSFFRIPGTTWVPVDISEAGRLKSDDPAKAEYFFGSHTSNRVTLSVGREIVLEPAQAGKPLNFFLNPYAEADGKPVATSKDWSFEDVAP